jgi:hypothetical protein
MIAAHKIEDFQRDCFAGVAGVTTIAGTACSTALFAAAVACATAAATSAEAMTGAAGTASTGVTKFSSIVFTSFFLLSA